MARVEVLGALCGSSVNYGSVRGTGSATLQGIELAGYLSGLGPEATSLAMAKYMGDDAALHKLQGFMRSWVNGLALSEGWFGTDINPLRRLLADLPIIEVISPQTCKRCHGVGFVAAKVCSKCGGTGHVLMSERSVAVLLEMHSETFRRIWRDRYGRVLARVQSFDADVHRAVSRQVCADMNIGF